jgi:hypothetical protein
MTAVQSIGLIVGLFAPLPDTEDLNLGPVGRWRAPDIKFPIKPRAGPVHLTVQYPYT